LNGLIADRELKGGGVNARKKNNTFSRKISV
jgi:hypothetical protein